APLHLPLHLLRVIRKPADLPDLAVEPRLLPQLGLHPLPLGQGVGLQALAVRDHDEVPTLVAAEDLPEPGRDAHPPLGIDRRWITSPEHWFWSCWTHFIPLCPT